MKIAVLGGGHGGYAAAADLSEAGHEVALWRRDAAALQWVIDSGCITLKDAGGMREVHIARATAEGIRQVAGSIQVPGGSEAVQLRVAEQYLTKFGELANASDTTMIVPAGVADVASMIGMAMNVIKRQAPTPSGGPA